MTPLYGACSCVPSNGLETGRDAHNICVLSHRRCRLFDHPQVYLQHVVEPRRHVGPALRVGNVELPPGVKPAVQVHPFGDGTRREPAVKGLVQRLPESLFVDPETRRRIRQRFASPSAQPEPGAPVVYRQRDVEPRGSHRNPRIGPAPTLADTVVRIKLGVLGPELSPELDGFGCHACLRGRKPGASVRETYERVPCSTATYGRTAKGRALCYRSVGRCGCQNPHLINRETK